MSVRVHSSLLYEDLVHGVPDPSAPTDTGDDKPPSRPSTERRMRRNQKKLDLYKTQTLKMLSEQEKKSKELLAANKARRDAAYNSLLSKLESESLFLEKIDEFLALKEHTDRRKQQRLYKEWHKRVFTVIQSQIEKRLADVPTAEIESRRRELFDQFLKAANRKEGLFRDIITSDYDPFANTRTAVLAATANARAKGDQSAVSTLSMTGPVTYNASKIHDPLKADIVRVERERRMVDASAHHTDTSASDSDTAAASAASSILKPVIRDGLDILLWNKLESTPHGRYAKMFADAADRKDGHLTGSVEPPPRWNTTKSTLVMDHFNVTSDPKVSKAEFFPKGKKVCPMQAGSGFDLI